MQEGHRRRRKATKRWIMILLGVLAALGAAPATPRPPIAVPRDRAGWEAKRLEIRSDVFDALGLPAKPEGVASNGVETLGPVPGSVLWTCSIKGESGKSLEAKYFRPAGASPEARVPAILFLGSHGASGPDGPMSIGPDRTRPVDTLLQRGFAVFVPETGTTGAPPWVADESGGPGPTSWGDVVRLDRLALEALVARPEVDPKRVGVAGVGLAGMRAWWLLALDERIACGVAVGGISRISDWQAEQGKSSLPLASWAKTLLGNFDTEAVMALCAPRHLQIMGGDLDPLAPPSGFKTLRDTSKKVYAAMGSGGPSYTIFGDLAGEFTLLEWDALLETFDKEFLPQGPTPLGHAPEAEPAVDSRFINPAEHGIAGWVPEMSQRPGTWTWQDGVITCKPGRNEYGWLRMPVDLGDFVLQLEWRVPKGGNSGVFLRAKPVPWQIAPSEKGKQRVSTLGLDWPSRTGLELQAQDDPGHADKYSSGSLYRHAAPAANPTKPPGEWNRYTVRARGFRVEVWSNGQQVLDTTIDKYPTLRKPPLKGYIGLQDHGVLAEFRNIRYLPLGAETRTVNRP